MSADVQSISGLYCWMPEACLPRPSGDNCQHLWTLPDAPHLGAPLFRATTRIPWSSDPWLCSSTEEGPVPLCSVGIFLPQEADVPSSQMPSLRCGPGLRTCQHRSPGQPEASLGFSQSYVLPLPLSKLLIKASTIDDKSHYACYLGFIFKIKYRKHLS